MRILITSGGTSVAIDPVRQITNMSTGRFGARLATSALLAGTDVIYLTAQTGQTPFSMSIDLHQAEHTPDALKQLETLQALHAAHGKHYQEYRYHDVNDYALQLETLINTQKPDIVMLAAAVSDYLVDNYSTKKIRSQSALTIQLKTAPKIIHSVKTWAPNVFLVGFKLLVDVDETTLINAALDSMMQHDCDLVIANDLASIRRGKHEVFLVERDGSYQKYSDNPAEKVINNLVTRWHT